MGRIGHEVQRQQRSIVIHSPHSGRSAQLSQALAALQQHGVELVRVISIAELDNLPPQGTIWQQQGIDIAVAAGGDGLAGGVTTHIAESTLPLGILPLGTANDIARSLQIPQDISKAAEVIARGNVQTVDVGVARPAEQAPHPTTTTQSGPVLRRVPTEKHGYFAHALTVGLNVQFARIATNVVTRQRYGRLTYPVAALELLKFHEALEVELLFEGLAVGHINRFRPGLTEVRPATAEENVPLRRRTLQVAIINAPIFGGQWQLAIPGAKLGDGLLDIVVIEDLDFNNLNTRLAQLFGHKEQSSLAERRGHEYHPGELTGIPGIHHLQAHGVTITTSADPRDATLDGEVRGQTPMYVQVADAGLRVVVPGQATTS
jgi:diacylglycerol kinase (ATP)